LINNVASFFGVMVLHFTTFSGKLVLYHNCWGDFMHCAYCGSEELRVIDSRSVDEMVRRRRKCVACGARFTTYERTQPHDIFVIKRDGRREEFSRDKLFVGIRKACEKRPLPTGAIDKFVETIEAELYKVGRSEISSSYIGDLVMEGLRKLDHIAYIRFASVYRKFADIGDLKQEVDSLASRGQLTPVNQLPLPAGEPARRRSSLAGEAVNSLVGHKRR